MPLWDVISFILLQIYRRFRRTYSAYETSKMYVYIAVVYLPKHRRLHPKISNITKDLLLVLHSLAFFYISLSVHLSIIFDNDQLDTQLLDFTIRLL